MSIPRPSSHESQELAAVIASRIHVLRQFAGDRVKSVRAWALISVLLAGVLAAVTPAKYVSRFSFVPQASQDPARSGLASLAGQFGISLAGASSAMPPQLYADLLRTQEVLGPVAGMRVRIDSGTSSLTDVPSLIGVAESDSSVRIARTVKALRERVIGVSVAARTTGLVTVNVRTMAPLASQQIGFALLAELERFNRVTRQSQAAEERRFLEKRLSDATDVLRGAEDEMVAFLRRNRQVESSAELRFERERLQRMLTLHSEVVSSLSQQYEESRIREVRDTPVLTTIEAPTYPFKRDRKRQLIVFVVGTTFLVTLSGTVIFVRWIVVRDSAAVADVGS